ncbi:MAG: S9 family peptidase [Gemmataceae bacterium]|nr:S9 family peptidase [Gemmataceae bacterium]
MKRTAILALLLVLPAARAVTIEDYFSLATVTDLAVSPDGKRVAYCEARWDKKADDRKADLWMVATDGKTKPLWLTSDRANERHPRWATDGKSVFVLANRKRAGEKAPWDGKTQVWRVFLDGRDPKPITKHEGGVQGFDLGGESLFYAVDSEKKDDDDFSKLRAEFGKLEYGHGTRKTSIVLRIDLGTWRETKVIDEGRYIREMAATRDGEKLAMITAIDDSVIESEGRARVDVWEDGKVTPTDHSWMKTAASLYPWLESLAWSPSGKKLAFCTIFDAYPTEIITNEWEDGKAKASRMKRPKGWQVRGYGSPLRWKDEAAPAYLAERAGNVVVASGGLLIEPEAGTVDSVFDVAADSKTFVVLSGRRKAFPDLFSGTGRLTDLNPHAKKRKLPSVEHVTWKAPDGIEVGGVLELPHGYEKGKKLPLIVGIHGGPTTSVKANLEFNPYDGRLWLAAKGYAVLCPNYRGSTGYGDTFTRDLIGNENDLDVKDIVAGIQHLVKEGIADPERVGVMGWSNGGYLTNCLITMKNPAVKIKAASSGAGILDCVAEWGFNDEPAYPLVFKKGLPWEQPDLYRKTSPTYGLGNVTTPTLIHVGANDERCPPGHSRMLYRALKEYKKVPTQLVVYPGEPHGLGRYSSRLAKMKWDAAWFDKYLK